MATPVPTHPQETLRRAQRVEIVALRQVNDAMVGAYLSRFKGRGTDFEELREYVPGDDVRAMDWNVTARTGKPFVRLHREERELTLVLAVDVSGSAGFGSGEQTLRERAADVAACLAVSALKAGDKVGLLLFTDREELWVAPRKGRRHVLRVIREVLEFRPVSRRTSFVQPMRRLGSPRQNPLPCRLILWPCPLRMAWCDERVMLPAAYWVCLLLTVAQGVAWGAVTLRDDGYHVRPGDRIQDAIDQAATNAHHKTVWVHPTAPASV